MVVVGRRRNKVGRGESRVVGRQRLGTVVGVDDEDLLGAVVRRELMLDKVGCRLLHRADHSCGGLSGFWVRRRSLDLNMR